MESKLGVGTSFRVILLIVTRDEEQERSSDQLPEPKEAEESI